MTEQNQTRVSQIVLKIPNPEEDNKFNLYKEPKKIAIDKELGIHATIIMALNDFAQNHKTNLKRTA